jgi:hypothetical protein
MRWRRWKRPINPAHRTPRILRDGPPASKRGFSRARNGGAAREIRAMVCVNVAATGEGAPMADTYDVILRLVQNVQKDEASIGVLSTGEQLAVALVLDRKDLLDKFGYTMLGAADRVGQDWLKAALKVQRDWF